MTALPPDPKVGYGKLIASGSTMAASLAIYFGAIYLGHPFPADIQAAITGVAALIAHYYTPNGGTL